MQAIFLITVLSCILVSADAAGAGEACTDNAGCTAANSACVSTVCACNDGYTKSGTSCTNGAAGAVCKADGTCADATVVCESSVCKIKAGQACTAPTTNCVSQSTCSTDKCTCNSGYTALTTGLCNGVAPQSVSSWLLTGSIFTLLVTLCLP